MELQYLIDTDWAIDHLRGKNEKVRDKIKEFRSSGIAISIISVAELYCGIYYISEEDKRKKKEEQLEAFLSVFKVLSIEKAICKIFAQTGNELKRNGKCIDNFDLMIASTALFHNLTLLTNNRKHFDRIVGLQIISIQETI
ncbi:MAG: type II toxin-antitoxin system VapC family toxin [Candidatus Magnetoovum sp. WYHC-5]|nr:type II toxin-antitoxin system VapC family toxin [Candidatus Magnetoovum sp. WYHC-5]